LPRLWGGGWRSWLVYIGDEDVAGEVLHVYAVSTMRGRKTMPSQSIGTVGWCWAATWASASGLLLGCGFELGIGLLGGLRRGLLRLVSFLSFSPFYFYFLFSICPFEFIFEFCFICRCFIC
jgi:hypothetical protein